MNIRSFIEHFSPPRCLLCEAAGGPVCTPCSKDLPWLPDLRCPVCALPTPGGETCGHCLKSPPAFSHTQALFHYAFPVDRMIQQYKYREQLALAPLFGSLLAESLKDSLADVWLPMPLHANRLRERGFNQAVEIARELARRTGIPMQAAWATRDRDTPPQAGLKREARRKNMRGAFHCSDAVSGMRVGIVDDVMTTGSTLDALAETLKNAGAVEVSCAVIARA